MSGQSLASSFATEAAKGTPPVLIAASQVVGAVDWQPWVLLLTLLYLLMQMGWLAWKFVDKALGKKVDG